MVSTKFYRKWALNMWEDDSELRFWRLKKNLKKRHELFIFSAPQDAYSGSGSGMPRTVHCMALPDIRLSTWQQAWHEMLDHLSGFQNVPCGAQATPFDCHGNLTQFPLTNRFNLDSSSIPNNRRAMRMIKHRVYHILEPKKGVYTQAYMLKPIRTAMVFPSHFHQAQGICPVATGANDCESKATRLSGFGFVGRAGGVAGSVTVSAQMVAVSPCSQFYLRSCRRPPVARLGLCTPFHEGPRFNLACSPALQA
eukprot:2120078-Amphidinium_carterae.1